MNRTMLTVAGLFGASSLLLVDSAVKGTAMLALAAVAAMVLRRDSAATRHLLWLLAMGALLVVPVMSALLPEWRVLPPWASIPPETAVVDTSPPSIARPADYADYADELPRNADPEEAEPPSATAYRPAAGLPDSRAALVTAEIAPEPAVGSRNWIHALPLVWAIGFCVLILRLMAARWVLWNAEWRGTVVWSSRQPAKATHDPLAAALEAACLQLEIHRPVTLLIHPGKTIPVVWGTVRCHLMLPAAARQWSGERLRCVLLHELAHVKRRDMMAQLLARIACALYWFNPLAWFAAWRLGVEGERACDDLVLASGVRPSAYAGHLLEVVTGLSPARWTQSCGLAMARKSSLEGRLRAVLGERLNRRGVSMAIAAIALATTVGIAVPIAMLRAADQEPNEQPDSGETNGAAAADMPEPKGKEAQTLFQKWLDGARANGKIPGGALGPLARAAANFVKLNPTDERAPKLAELLKRIDTSHEWTRAEAVALLDEVTAIYPSLPRWVEHAKLFSLGGDIRTGQPLPAELENAPWGEPRPGGLRMAWLLEPRVAEHRLGTPLKSRILFHNAGKNTVVFRALTWYQSWAHKARDAKGTEINVASTHWTTVPRIVACRLAPGEFMEVAAAGIGVGAMGNPEDWQNTRVGAWIEAKAGDEVTFTPAPVAVNGRRGDVRSDAEPGWWLDFIKDRLSLDMPLPADGGERGRLLDRAARDLFGTAPAPEETAAFVADPAPDALDALARRLAQRAGVSPFTGTLQSGETTFRILPADPDAAKRPRAANNPGRYTLCEGVVLAVSRRPDGERIVNQATIQFSSSDPTKPVPGEPYELQLPDGYNTWAAAWVRGGVVLWLRDESGVRGFDFSNPMKVKEEATEPDNVPAEIREALGGAIAPLDAWQARIVERLPAWIKPLYNQGLLATLDDNDEVATLTTSRVMNDELLARLKTLPKLRELDIEVTRGIEALRAHPRLEHVSLRAMDVTDQSLRYLAQIPTLTRLDLYGSGQTGVVAGRNFSMAGLEALKALPRLDTLCLTNFDLPGGGYVGLKELKQLRQLSFMMCNVSGGDLDALEDAPPNASISSATGGGGRLPKKLRKPLSQ